MNQKLKSYTAQTYIAYALIAPAALYIILIVAWPLLETIRLSFTNSSLAGEDYVGLENYQKMFSSKKFNGIVTRTFVWMFFSVSLKLLIGLIGAVLLNANLKGRSIFRVLVMPPWVVPIAIGMLGWLWLYNGYFEMLGSILWGSSYCFAESPAFNSLLNDFKIIKPTIFISIPKRWLQIYEMLQNEIDRKSVV